MVHEQFRFDSHLFPRGFRITATADEQYYVRLQPLDACLPRTLTNFSMIVQKVKALNLKLCRTLIHTYLLNKQEKSPDKTKNQNAKSRACLKAVFLKNPFVPLFFTHR